MKPYHLQIPTKICFGRNIWEEALKEQEDLLQGNVMIVTTGRSLKRLGYLDALQAGLKSVRCVKHVSLFDCISANPRLSEIREGIRVGRENRIDVVVGFGGGSAMDAAKAVAAGIPAADDIDAYFYQGREPGPETRTIIAMPTTAGSGSELSRAAILTDDERKIKSGIRGNALFPSVAIVDCMFTESVPLQATMETGFDVAAHAVESYICIGASPYTRIQSEYAVRIVGKCLPALRDNLQDLQAREYMSLASMLMGINLGNAGTCLPHRLQYPLGAHTDTCHGAGLAALFPAWIKEEYSYEPERVERITGLLTREAVHGSDACGEVIGRFIRNLGLPVSLSQLGVDREQLPVMASEVSGNIGNDPAARGAGGSVIQKLYDAAWQ